MLKKVIVNLFLILSILGPVTYAADYYSIANGASATITEHSVCREISNSAGATIFIPTKTSSEWSSCYTTNCNAISGVTVSTCNLIYVWEGNSGGGTTPAVTNGATCTTEGAIGYDPYTLAKTTTYYEQVCRNHVGVWKFQNSGSSSFGRTACSFSHPFLNIPELRYGCDSLNSYCETNSGTVWWEMRCLAP